MYRGPHRNTDAPSHDSFLDIVANMVGILIILVMVVGVRVKNAPVVVAAVAGKAAEIDAELQKQRTTEESLYCDLWQLNDRIKTVENETLVQTRQRDMSATLVSALEHKIRSRRDRMDAQAKQQFDLTQKVSDSRLQLDQMRRQRIQVETAPAAPIVMQSYPTPLSQTTIGPEAHFQLLGERVTLIPIEQLIDRFKEDFRRQKYKLLDLPELTDTVGPIGGFRLRYTMRRRDVSPEVAMVTGRGGSYAELTRWTLIPVSSELGEPVKSALAEGSEFRRALSTLDPQRVTITIWTYPDSFAAFRQLKKELYRLAFSTAARPLPHGIPISGSPEGSRSAAQ